MSQPPQRRRPRRDRDNSPRRDRTADAAREGDGPAGPQARLVAGLQPVREALRAHGGAVSEVRLVRGDNPRLAALARFCRDQGVAVRPATRAELDRLCRGVRHQGAVAFAPALQLIAIEALLARDPQLLVALDGVTDPHNFGATVRSAVAFGADGVVWGEHHAAPLSPSMFRASAGAVEHATLCQVASLRAAVTACQAAGVLTVALDSNGETPLAQVDLTAPCLLVIGAEDKGVGRGVRRACAVTARLPMRSAVASLNASVAAATALYEAIRQKKIQ